MPVTKQSIAFIGATSPIASALARGTANDNYRLLLFDRVTDEIKPLAQDIESNIRDADLTIMDCAHECSWEADVIMLDVSEDRLDEVISDIHDVATQKIVVQLSNDQKEKSNSTSITEKLHSKLPHSNIVHLWSTETIDQNYHPTESTTLYLSGDDTKALQTVSEIIETAGFRPLVKDVIREEI